MIQAWEIGRMDERYTTEASGSVKMYTVDGCNDLLTFGQLMIAVSCRQAAVLEARSVAKMNQMGAKTESMHELANVMEAIYNMDESVRYGDCKVTLRDGQSVLLRRWLEDVQDFSIDVQPSRSKLMTPATKLTLLGFLRPKMEHYAQASQEDNVDLRSLVNARDVAYKTSTQLVNVYANTGMNTVMAY